MGRRAASFPEVLPLRPAQRPERDRVAERLRGRHVVLPGIARLPGEDVAGAWLQLELEGVAHAALVAAEAHPRRGAQGYPDDDPEGGRVAMPAHLRARRGTLDEDRRHLLRLHAGQLGRALA